MESSLKPGQEALNVESIRRALLKWYQKHRRELPWRLTSDPYPVWISEVMLQQTQIATVMPYFIRFLDAFPTIESLAAARAEKVAEIWSGLGYYRRAYNLHLGAQKLVRENAGRFPSEYPAARGIPGVGHYTACAVLSIAYRTRLAAVDGNAARVIARVAALPGHFQQAQFRKAAEKIATDWLSRKSPGLSNQALMEIGQTICVPRAPQCPKCPLMPWCRAFRQGSQESYPETRPRRAVELRYLAVVVIRSGRSAALVRGLDEELLPGIWNFPAAFGSSPQNAMKNLQNKVCKKLALRVRWGRMSGCLHHQITYRSIRAAIYDATLQGRRTGDTLRWLPLDQIDRAAVSQLARKIARAELMRRGERGRQEHASPMHHHLAAASVLAQCDDQHLGRA